jgi:hypothetical protein
MSFLGVNRFELQKSELKQLKRLIRAQNHTLRLNVRSSSGSLGSPLDGPLAPVKGVRFRRQAAVGPVEDQPRCESQRRL